MFRVMIVDDMEIVRREIKRLKLWGEKTGFIIAEEARNGQEALEKIQQGRIDLVITDIKMPKIDGIELLRNIVEKDLCSCVVILSDFSDFTYTRQGIVLGAFDYLVKPVEEKELEKLLRRAGEYIISTKKEKDRIKKLEETLEEKVEVFFPIGDILQLIQLIHTGDTKVLEAAARIADVTGANLNHDLMKVESVLKSAMFKISKEVQESYKWIDKFVIIDELINIDFSKCDDFDTIRAEFISTIQKVFDILNTLRCGVLEEGIVSQVCKYVLCNIDSELSLKIISDKLFMNKTYISGTFKQKTGMSFIEYLTQMKMERAKILITEENKKSYEIAERLGFRDVEYFSKLFKKHTGLSPTEFRQLKRSKN